MRVGPERPGDRRSNRPVHEDAFGQMAGADLVDVLHASPSSCPT